MINNTKPIYTLYGATKENPRDIKLIGEFYSNEEFEKAQEGLVNVRFYLNSDGDHSSATSGDGRHNYLGRDIDGGCLTGLNDY